jgi:hypothetical protein
MLYCFVAVVYCEGLMSYYEIHELGSLFCLSFFVFSDISNAFFHGEFLILERFVIISLPRLYQIVSWGIGDRMMLSFFLVVRFVVVEFPSMVRQGSLSMQVVVTHLSLMHIVEVELVITSAYFCCSFPIINIKTSKDTILIAKIHT